MEGKNELRIMEGIIELKKVDHMKLFMMLKLV